MVLRWPAPARDGESVVLIADSVEAAAYALRAALAGERPNWAVAETFRGIPWTVPQEAAPLVLSRLVENRGIAAPGRLLDLPQAAALVLRTLQIASEAHLESWFASFDPVPRLSRASARSDVPCVEPMQRAGDTARTGQASVGAARSLAVFLDAVPFSLRPQVLEALWLFSTTTAQTGLVLGWSAAARAGPQAANLMLRRWFATQQPGGPVLRRAKADIPKGRRDKRRASLAAHLSGHLPDVPEMARADPAAHALPRRLDRIADQPEFAGAVSPHAGFWLLLRLLQHLDAQAVESALAVPICMPILAAFANRLGLPETDPSRAAVPETEFDGAMWTSPYRPPAAVLRKLAGNRPLRLRPDIPGRASLALARGPRGVGLVDAAGLRELRRMGVRMGCVPHRAATDTTEAARSLMFATQILAHRLTGKGWRRLCHRPGRVAVSDTHVDITFDGRDADPSVRIAGLDCDPGWVSWLGRVVNFHYDYSNLRDWTLAERQHGR